MKLTAFFTILLCVQVSAKTFSQNITLTARNMTLDKVLHLIELQSGYGVVYPEEIITKTRSVSLSVTNRPLAEVLNAFLAPQGLTWVLKNNTIIIRQQQTASSNSLYDPEIMAGEAAPAEYDISGSVTDEKGAPLSGASVQLKGTTKGTVTNEKGYFVLQNVAAGTHTLVISLIGYTPQEKKLTLHQATAITIALETAVNQLDETVIIAYGTTTKRMNTGSVSSLGTDAIAKQTITNPLTALQGRIAGVQITQDNGLAGGGVRMQIRGQGTTAAGFLPLYIIDGVPFTLFNGGTPATDGLNAFGTSGANGSISPFSVINPDDIERIDVLKDADATAIYGSRGANGVVLITTKKGAKSKTAYNLSFYQGAGKVNRFIPMMNTQEYLAMRREAFTNAGTTPTTTNAKDLTVYDQTAYTDWQKWAMGGTAHSSHASLGVSGGNAQNSFLLNTSYHREGTVYPGSYHTNTFSGRLTATHASLDNKFNVRLTTSYAYSNNNLPYNDLSSLYSFTPNYPLYNSDGKVNFDQTTNPLSMLMKRYTGRTDNLVTGLDVSYRLLPQLLLRANLGYTSTRLRQNVIVPARSLNSTATTSNSLTYADNSNDNYVIEPQVEYTPKVGAGKLQLLAGGTLQQTKATGISLYGTGYSSEATITSISSAATITVNSNNYSLYKYNGIFAKANYNLYSKYLLDVTFRRDGSSRFGDNHRFGTFGAAGAAWIFTEEAFMKNIRPISFGKLRASYGVTGNDQIPNYQYFSSYFSTGGTYSYNGSSVLIPNNFYNPDLHWETNKKLDIALELGFLKDRIFFKADYYRNRSSDQLVYVPLAGQAGSSSYLGNLPALVQNKGVELELSATPVKTKDWKWDVSVNFALNNNKLLQFPGLASSSYNTTFVIGQPLVLTQLYTYTGPSATTGEPTFADLDKDGSITLAGDRQPAYQGTPYFGGLATTLSWKGFTLDMAFQFNHRYGYINSTLISNFNAFGYSAVNQTTQVLDRWHSGDASKNVNLLPAASTAGLSGYYNYANSTANWGDASFIKFKTLSLTYAVPGQWIKKAGFTNANVFVRGQNLFVWAKQKYTYDPETTLSGTGANLGTGTYIAYPQLRVITAGFNLSF